MSKVFKTVLLLALPASGKSEVRNFMANIDPEKLKEDFHIGENLQLDDFPYVHFMRRIDEELDKLGEERIFYPSNDCPFNNEKDWGTLTLLIDEDYDILINSKSVNTDSYAMYLFSRIDTAGSKVGIDPRIAMLSEDVINSLAESLEEEAKEIVMSVESQFTDDLEGKTIVIECARGGPDGSELPLPEGYGYQYSLTLLSDQVLKDAVILYIWVTPEESRRKNSERANPDDPGSNLFHGVPLAVMLNEYGCDDMTYLLEHTEVPRTITIKKESGTWNIPIGIFDNRVDKTSFLRSDKSNWSEHQVYELTENIKDATDTMWSNYGSK